VAGTSLEDRITALEAEVEQLKKQLADKQPDDAVPWWKERFGAFKDDPLYDEAARLGAEYRRSQPLACDIDINDLSA
jgi:hypothetical protein